MVFFETTKFLEEFLIFYNFQQISTYRKRCTTDVLDFAADDGFLAIIALHVCFHTFHAFPLTWHRQHLIHIRTEADLIKL